MVIALMSYLYRNNWGSIILWIGCIFFLHGCKRDIENDYIFIHESSFFPNGKYDSIIEYYSKGAVKLIKKVNGNLSLRKEYYENGRLKLYCEYFKGERVGNSYFFHSTGKLQAYNYIDEYKDVCYVIKWDQFGRNVKEEGVVISPNVTLNNQNDLNFGDTLEVNVMVPNPPYTNTIVYGGIMDQNQKVVDSIEIPVVHGVASYKSKILLRDSIFPFFYGILFDEKKNVLKHDITKVKLIINDKR